MLSPFASLRTLKCSCVCDTYLGTIAGSQCSAMAVYERTQAIRSVFTPQLSNITLGGARTPLASAQSGAPPIGRWLFIVLIEDEVPLALFCETSLKFSEARGYKNISVQACWSW